MSEDVDLKIVPAAPVTKGSYDWLHSEFITRAEHGCNFRSLRKIRSSSD